MRGGMGGVILLAAAAARMRRAGLLLGALELREGTNPVFLKLVGRNPAAAALGLDVVTLTLERQP